VILGQTYPHRWAGLYSQQGSRQGQEGTQLPDSWPPACQQVPQHVPVMTAVGNCSSSQQEWLCAKPHPAACTTSARSNPASLACTHCLVVHACRIAVRDLSELRAANVAAIRAARAAAIEAGAATADERGYDVITVPEVRLCRFDCVLHVC
jgi:hypothetical protein